MPRHAGSPPPACPASFCLPCSLTALRQELRGFLTETGLPPNRMPTANQLLNAGRGDLCQAIVQRGGFIAAGQALGWGTQRRQRSAWVDAAVVAAELRQFILATQFPAQGSSSGGGSSSGASVADGKRRQSSRGAQQQQQEQQPSAEEGPLLAGARMPTHRELADAGRHDLK